MDNSHRQLDLNLSAHGAAPERQHSVQGEDSPADAAKKPGPRRQKHLLQRAVLRWLIATQGVTGAALEVPTRISKYRADAAGFRSKTVRNREEGPNHLLTAKDTFIVQCYLDREQCWPDCTGSDELLGRLQKLKVRQTELESRIREEEPELRDDDSLFEEYAEWNYTRTQNPEFHRLRREIQQTEHAVYKGTKFEQIRQAELADFLYLAVPAGEVHDRELAEGWGLLWVSRDMDVSCIREPQQRECRPANRSHLIQNIATAATHNVLFTNGLYQTEGGIRFVKPPRGHRRPVQPQLW